MNNVKMLLRVIDYNACQKGSARKYISESYFPYTKIYHRYSAMAEKMPNVIKY